MKKTLSLLLAAVLCLSLLGCGQSAKPLPEAPAETPAAEAPAETAPAATPTPVPTPKPIKVTLYKGDDNAEYLLPVDCEIPSLTPQTIIDELLELGVLSAPVTVNSFDQDSANIIFLDLSRDFSDQINQMGTAGEYIMLGSLINSFISAFGADGVHLTVNGENLETGHNIYDETLIFFES